MIQSSQVHRDDRSRRYPRSATVSAPPKVENELDLQDTSYLGYGHQSQCSQDYYSQSQTQYYDQSYNQDYSYADIDTFGTSQNTIPFTSAPVAPSRASQGQRTQDSYAQWDSSRPIQQSQLHWPQSEMKLRHNQLEALPIRVITSNKGDKFLSSPSTVVNSPSTVVNSRKSVLFPHLPANAFMTSPDNKDKFDIQNVQFSGASSEEDQPMKELITRPQGTNLDVPPEFPKLFQEIIQLEGLKPNNITSDTLPSGQVIQRLPSASAEIDQFFKCHEVSTQMETQNTHDCYPQQPDFIHRVHTDKHVGSTDNTTVSQALLSSVPWQFGALRVGSSVTGPPKRQRVRWPANVQRNVETSTQHVLDLVRHQDLYTTVAATSLQEAMDRIDNCKENKIPVNPETLDIIQTEIRHSLQALNNSINLQSAVYSHQTFSMSCLELSRRHRFLSRTTFLPNVSSHQIRQLALNSPLGTSHLISPLQCTAAKLALPQEQQTSVTPHDPRNQQIDITKGSKDEVLVQKPAQVAQTDKVMLAQEINNNESPEEESMFEDNDNDSQPEEGLQPLDLAISGNNLVNELLQGSTPLLDENVSSVLDNDTNKDIDSRF